MNDSKARDGIFLEKISRCLSGIQIVRNLFKGLPRWIPIFGGFFFFSFFSHLVGMKFLPGNRAHPSSTCPEKTNDIKPHLTCLIKPWERDSPPHSCLVKINPRKNAAQVPSKMYLNRSAFLCYSMISFPLFCSGSSQVFPSPHNKFYELD